jgi:hypothetical protein
MNSIKTIGISNFKKGTMVTFMVKYYLSCIKQSNTSDFKQGIWYNIFTVAEGYGGKGQGKAVPLQVWTGPQGSRRLRLPDF